jgi:hypothetical protein
MAAVSLECPQLLEDEPAGPAEDWTALRLQKTA